MITHGAGIGGLSAEDCAEAIAEGTLLGLYRFLRHKKKPEDEFEVESLTLVEHDAAKMPVLERGVEKGGSWQTPRTSAATWPTSPPTT